MSVISWVGYPLDDADYFGSSRKLSVLFWSIAKAHDIQVECEIPRCICPEGRNYWELKGRWSLSTDRVLPARQDGKYVTSNVRPAHFSCNASDGNLGRVHYGPPSPRRPPLRIESRRTDELTRWAAAQDEFLIEDAAEGLECSYAKAWKAVIKAEGRGDIVKIGTRRVALHSGRERNVYRSAA